MPTIVEIKTFGDFDMKYTDHIYFNESPKCFDLSHLHQYRFDSDPSRIIKELKVLGFRNARGKTVEVLYGSD